MQSGIMINECGNFGSANDLNGVRTNYLVALHSRQWSTAIMGVLVRLFNLLAVLAAVRN